MKILFVTNSPIEYSSSANIRNTSLVRGLVENGHVIHILTCSPDKNSKYYDPTIAKDIGSSIQYIDKTNEDNDQSGKKAKIKNSQLYQKIRNNLYKTYNYFAIYDHRKRNLKNIDKLEFNEGFDILISSSDPKSSHLIAENIAKKMNIEKWIQYWGDPLAADINKKSIVPQYMLKKEELRLLEKATTVFYVSPITFDIQKNMYKKIGMNMRYLPIPIQISSFHDQRNELNSDVRIGYYGDYYTRDRNILPLVNACSNSGFNLEIYGRSDIKIENKNNIQVNERTSYEKIKAYENKIDILVCLCNKKGGQIPGKIYHYAASSKPILLILDGEYKKIIRNFFGRYPNYYICDNNKESICSAITEIMSTEVEISPIEDFNSKSIAFKMIETLRLSVEG